MRMDGLIPVIRTVLAKFHSRLCETASPMATRLSRHASKFMILFKIEFLWER